MKSFIFALAGVGLLLGVSSAEDSNRRVAARSDSSNLAGGVLIAHYPTGMAYTDSDVCEYYSSDYALDSYQGQMNRIDAPEGTLLTWFVIAAWAEPKQFCGAEFGLNAYDQNAFALLTSSCGACGSTLEPLEIPDGAWPGPGTGVALAIDSAAPWRGNYVPIYYFSGYPYAPGTRIELTVSPTNHFAGMANCLTPPVPASAACLGAMGILQDGSPCIPEINPDGACCFGGGACQIMSQGECDAAGGAWDGSPECLDPNPCPVIWACCMHEEATGVESCQMLIQNDCLVRDGFWHSGSACGVDGFTCPPIRACCVNEICTLTTLEDCTTSSQGIWLSGTFSCVSPTNPCLFSRACCIWADCQVVTLAECNTLGGFWLQNIEACADGSVCPMPLRACCFQDDGGISCQLLVEPDCTMRGGVFFSEWTVCDLYLCGVPLASLTTWGRLKSLFR